MSSQTLRAASSGLSVWVYSHEHVTAVSVERKILLLNTTIRSAIEGNVIHVEQQWTFVETGDSDIRRNCRLRLRIIRLPKFDNSSQAYSVLGRNGLRKNSDRSSSDMRHSSKNPSKGSSLSSIWSYGYVLGVGAASTFPCATPWHHSRDRMERSALILLRIQVSHTSTTSNYSHNHFSSRINDLLNDKNFKFHWSRGAESLSSCLTTKSHPRTMIGRSTPEPGKTVASLIEA